MTVHREDLLDDFQNRLEKLNETNNRANDADAGVHEPLRRIGAYQRRPQHEDDSTANGFNALIQQVSGESMGESDRLVGELTKMRNVLQVERDRLVREIADYTALNQSALTAMKTISDNLTQYQRTGKLEARRA